MISKTAHPIDVLIGKNLRAFREAKKLSQASVADAIGVSRQQVQEYEIGASRIGSRRLARIAKVLGVPIERFFSGGTLGMLQEEAVADLLARPYALDLLRALSKIEDLEVRRNLVALTESIVGLTKR